MTEGDLAVPFFLPLTSRKAKRARMGMRTLDQLGTDPTQLALAMLPVAFFTLPDLMH